MRARGRLVVAALAWYRSRLGFPTQHPERRPHGEPEPDRPPVCPEVDPGGGICGAPLDEEPGNPWLTCEMGHWVHWEDLDLNPDDNTPDGPG